MRVSLTSHPIRSDKPAKVSITVHSNDRLWELRDVVSQALGLTADTVWIYTAGRPLPHDLNSKHLHELHIKDGQPLLVTKRAVPIARVDLLDATHQATPLLRVAISHIFHKFAPQQPDPEQPERRAMIRADMAAYIIACGAGESSASDQRMSEIFEQVRRDRQHVIAPC